MVTEQSQVSQKQERIGPMIAVMLIGAFVGILNETLLATALPSIMDDFGINENKAQWLTTAFLLANGVMVPITAFLIERFPTRKLFLTALSILGLGTLISAFAHVFPLLLVGRVIQAAGSGIMLPLMMTVILTVIPKEKRGKMMGLAGIVISFGPAIGPTLSGWLLQHFSWRALFYVVLPIVVLTFIFAYIVIKNVIKLTHPKMDILSIILSSLGFGGLLFGFSSAGDGGWTSLKVIVSLIAGVIILGLFIWRQLKLQTPLLQFRVFKFKAFSVSIVITMIVMMSMIGAETLLPLYIQNLRGFTALQSGLVLLPGAVVMGMMSPVTGALFDKFGAKWLALPGLTIVAVTTFIFTDMTLETPLWFIAVIYAVRMFGLSFAMMPVMTSGLNQVPMKWNAHGSAMANTMQQVSASIGTAILITVMTSGAKSYEPDASALQGLTQQEAKLQIAHQAQLSGYNDAFIFATSIAVAGAVFSLFLKNKSASE
ncbi:cholic acid efflux MFS transporter MdrT [Lentibacillus halophilus]|uniref:Cholic acid efflux MFS transporter MdrT n=1 Tax=Lentibacillus halophilus TaxID=295065 RepID=A0ABN0Z6T3_9BACI